MKYNNHLNNYKLNMESRKSMALASNETHRVFQLECKGQASDPWHKKIFRGGEGVPIIIHPHLKHKWFRSQNRLA